MVSGSESNTGESGGQHRLPSPFFTYTEKFEELCPYYLAIGMTYDQYWDGPAEMAIFFRKAAKIRQDLENQQAWLQGAYFYEVMVDVAPIYRANAKKGTKPEPYRTEPLDIYATGDDESKKKVEDKHDEQAKAYMDAFALAVNKKFAEKGGGTNG